MINHKVKQLARVGRVGHRVSGSRRLGCSTVVARETQVAICNTTCLAHAELLTDEKQPTTVGLLNRTVPWLIRQGIECRPLPHQTLATDL